jgi:DNA end-binding protein Ku
MKKTGRTALAKWDSRGKQYIAMVRAMDKGLVLQMLHYANEVRSIDEVPIPDAELKEAELNLGVMLIEQIASDTFNPEKYEDSVKKRVLAAIDRKVQGQEVIDASPMRRAQIDLMEALKASLAAAGPRAVAPAPSEPSPATVTAMEDHKEPKAARPKRAAKG